MTEAARKRDSPVEVCELDSVLVEHLKVKD